jgi:hypothetical protein
VGLGLWGFVGSEFCGGLDCGSWVSIEEDIVEKQKREQGKERKWEGFGCFFLFFSLFFDVVV